MLKWCARIGASAILALGVIATADGPATAANKKLLGTFQNWDAFLLNTDNNQTMCYVVSLPQDTAPKGVNRGETYITVTHSPARKVRDEVNVIAGYPYRDGSEVTLNIDGARKSLFTQGDAAWAYDPAADGDIVAAFKRGINLTVTGVSSRDTTTRDQYSLRGFTNAYNAASAACPG